MSDQRKEKRSNPSTDLISQRRCRNRRLARAGVALLAAVALTVSIVTFLTPFPQNQAIAYLDNCADPPPVPGPARPWEADIQVSTYSTANTRSGNLFTQIPVVSWSGVGPDLDLRLYHNSAAVGFTDTAAAVGFDLGPGWSMSYGDHLLLGDLPNTVTVVYADGRRDVYTDNNGLWQAPTGVWAVLLEVDGDTWKVVFKDGSFLEFEDKDDGTCRFSRVVDPMGNAAIVQYGSYGLGLLRISEIVAAGRSIEFIYDTDTQSSTYNKLLDLKDPDDGDAFPEVHDRFWTLHYYTNGRLWRLEDAMQTERTYGYGNEFEYDADGRLASVSDKFDLTPGSVGPKDVYQYTYYGTGPLFAPGRIHTVIDPDNGLEQEFETICGIVSDQERFYTIHHDRRGSEWKYYYYRSNNPSEAGTLYPDGNLMEIWEPGTSGTVAMGYDEDRLVWWANDALGNGFEATYDTNGNMLSRIDQMLHEQTWEYDAHNNVTSYTDGAGNTTRFYYDHSYETQEALCVYPLGSGVPCRLCDGGVNDGLECEVTADCPNGTCIMDDSVCMECEAGTAEGEPCTNDNDCPDSTCIGACELVTLPPKAPNLLTRIVEPNATSNPPANQLPGEEGTYPVTRLSWHLSSFACEQAGNTRYHCNGQLTAVIDPNGVRSAFEYDQWGQEAYYAEGKYLPPPRRNLLGAASRI